MDSLLYLLLANIRGQSATTATESDCCGYRTGPNKPPNFFKMDFPDQPPACREMFPTTPLVERHFYSQPPCYTESVQSTTQMYHLAIILRLSKVGMTDICFLRFCLVFYQLSIIQSLQSIIRSPDTTPGASPDFIFYPRYPFPEPKINCFQPPTAGSGIYFPGVC